MKLIAALTASLLVLQASQRSAEPEKEPRGAEPLGVLNAERAWAGADALWPLILDDKGSSDVHQAALRAVGRLEDPAQVRQLMSRAGPAAADAIAQSLQGFDPTRDPELLSLVAQWMRVRAGGESATTRMAAPAVAALAPAMSRIAYATAAQVGDIELLLSELAGNAASDPQLETAYVAAIQGLESLARVNTKLVAFDRKTIERLRNAVLNASPNDKPAARRYAFVALVAGRAVDAAAVRKALADTDDWQLRRAAMAVLTGAGAAGLDADTRITLARGGLKDDSAHVRYEAVRAYARHGAPVKGCGPLLDAIRDEDTIVAIEALDRLGDACKEDEDVTRRLGAEAEVPPPNQYWHRPTHAFVALAKRSPEAAALKMEAFVTHQIWWVRMYSAFAAAGAKDLLHLNKLAYDENDNVREAALGHLRRLDKEAGDRATLAALERSDVQLVRAAALALKETPPQPTLFKPLLASLQRLTKDGRLTSRDARVALLQAIDRHATPQDDMDVKPFLRDADPKIAEAAALVLAHMGKPAEADPRPAAHVPSQPFDDLLVCARVDMSPGKAFRLRLDPASAPIAGEQFLKLATIDKYYNGLTFHRVVPNFVIQGGSPGANEYSGAKDFWRDEIAAPNVRGTVGLSTRGRNTADAQIFINLIDNARLNGQYTVFASVLPEDMDTVDRIQEGDVIRSIDMTTCPSRRP